MMTTIYILFRNNRVYGCYQTKRLANEAKAKLAAEVAETKLEILPRWTIVPVKYIYKGEADE